MSRGQKEIFRHRFPVEIPQDDEPEIDVCFSGQEYDESFHIRIRKFESNEFTTS